MSDSTRGTCKDCVAEAAERSGLTVAEWKKAERSAFFPPPRLAPHPGPRCATHHRLVVRQRKMAAHDSAVVRIYDDMQAGDYQRLYEAQGGRCAIPKCRATGKSKRLAVDHNHSTGEVRGLLCSTHNRLIGANFDDPVVFRGIADYLESPPARRVLR